MVQHVPHSGVHDRVTVVYTLWQSDYIYIYIYIHSVNVELALKNSKVKYMSSAT